MSGTFKSKLIGKCLDRQMSVYLVIGKCLMGKNLALTGECPIGKSRPANVRCQNSLWWRNFFFFAPRPVETQNLPSIFCFLYKAKNFYSVNKPPRPLLFWQVTTQKNWKVRGRLRHAEVQQCGHLLAQVSTNWCISSSACHKLSFEPSTTSVGSFLWLGERDTYYLS